jgi:Ca2+-binding RTX toxin-like protein
MAYSGSTGTGVTGGGLIPSKPLAPRAIAGTAGADVIYGTSGEDRIDGAAGGDTIFGRDGSDLVAGGGGADLLRGQGGDDRLDGGVGRDVLIGGAGNDVFVFGLARHSPGGSPDVIRAGDGAQAFEGAGRPGGDRIDLSGIDADATRAGHQVLAFGGSGKGHVVVVESGGLSLVRANTDDDAGFEFAVLIEDGDGRASAYTAADFIL